MFCYLDNNATTRVAPEVVEAMQPFFRELWGNPSSSYEFGHRLEAPLNEARAQVAALLNAEPREIVFTSCATESINTAIHSALAAQPEKRQIVTTAVEHSATLKCCKLLEAQGYEVIRLPVTSLGALSLSRLEESIGPETALVSTMWANNETGVLFPLAEIASLCRARGVAVHTDAVQMAGKLNLDLAKTPVDFLSLSAHKLHGPKGIGALFIRRGTRFHPYLLGGGQERNRRAGTENVPYMIGFGKAAELARDWIKANAASVRHLRDKLEQGICSSIADVAVNGVLEPRLPNTTNIAFRGVEAEGILLLLDQAGICASSGSACHSGALEPSAVLTAMGCSAGHARSSVRFSLGVYTTEAEVDYALRELPRIIGTLRARAPVL